jgi:periplasmic protein TonB
VRCVGCEMELQGPARHCQWCGREVPRHQVEETSQVSALKDGAPSIELPATPAAPPSKGEAASPKAEPDADAFWYAPAPSAAPAPGSSGGAPVKAESPRALPTTAATPTTDRVAGVRSETVGTAAVKTDANLLKQAKIEAAHAQKALKSAVVSKGPHIPAAPPRGRHPIVLAAVAVVGVAIGVGAIWVGMHNDAATARAQPAATPVAKNTATEVGDAVGRALPRQPPAATTPSAEDPKSTTMASPKASTSSRPRPTTPRAAAVPAAAAPDGAESSTREAAALPSVPTPVIAALVHVAEPAPAPALPVGPFFETKDVNESPRIAARVEPRVPEALRAHSTNDIVIVRALVSQSGHPSRISLLRRSKAGPELDTIVVEAVTQWTFEPARKKGEAVSCWLNFGVQLGGAE